MAAHTERVLASISDVRTLVEDIQKAFASKSSLSSLKEDLIGEYKKREGQVGRLFTVVIRSYLCINLFFSFIMIMIMISGYYGIHFGK